MSDADWDRFEMECDRIMAHWLSSNSHDLSASPTSDSLSSNELWHQWLAALLQAAGLVIGMKNVSRSSMPGFDKEAASFSQIRLLAWNILNSDGTPSPLAWKKYNQIKVTLRRLIKRKRRSKQLKFFQELESCSSAPRRFFSSWWATNRPSTNKLPCSVLRADGSSTTDSTEILQAWKIFAESLGKESVPINRDPGDRIAAEPEHTYDDDFARRVYAAIRSVCLDPNGTIPDLDAEITWEEVHAVLRSLPAGKSAGPDGIPNEMLLNGGVGLELALVKLFNHIWGTNSWPPDWQRAILVPLFKGEGSRLDPSDHRLLALMSTVAKTFEKILDNRLRRWSDRVGALSDLQGGFRAGRCTLDQVFTLSEIARMHKEKSIPLYLGFIDVRKAYDRVWLPGLWFKLQGLGLSPKFLSLLKSMFSKITRCVRVNGSLTEDFPVHVGVPQGSVLSPALYALYIDGLHRALRDAGLGVWVFGQLVPLLLYADDIVLLAPTPTQLHAMLQVLETYASRWRLTSIMERAKSLCLALPPLQ